MPTKMGQKKQSIRKPIKRTIKLNPLDILFSRYIRAKAGYTCEFCGRKPANRQGLHCSHFIGRRYQNTRFLETNCACLCFTCHNYMHDFPSVHREFFIKRIGSDKLEQLEIIARTKSFVDRDAIAKDLKEKLKALE